MNNRAATTKDNRPLSWPRRARRGMTAFAIDGFFRGLATAGRIGPLADPARYGIDVVRDVAYEGWAGPAHTLDIYLPREAERPLPVVIYIHGGAFRFLSKESHWAMATLFARRGYLVYNINYRLAPRHPYPAALEDVCAAYEWVVGDAPLRGGDTGRLVVTGESAGGNLATVLTLGACYRREEDFMQRVWDTGVVPAAAVPACGILQVTDVARFARAGGTPAFVQDYLSIVPEAYLGDRDARPDPAHALADPLLILEQGIAPDRPLPPFFAPVGTLDPIQDDTRRLAAALTDLGVPNEARYYEGGIHAFHAFLWRSRARRAWRDTFAFLTAHLPTKTQ